jgi:hypothetical protein
MMLYDHEALYERNLLVGFSWLIVLAVSLNALGGIAVSMALKCGRPPCTLCPPCTPCTHGARRTRRTPSTLCPLCTLTLHAHSARPLCTPTLHAHSARPLCMLCTRARPRYADNIQKTFAVGISIVLNCLVRGRSTGPCAS